MVDEVEFRQRYPWPPDVQEAPEDLSVQAIYAVERADGDITGRGFARLLLPEWSQSRDETEHEDHAFFRSVKLP